jgi:tetratricopeptide (TPR) repeat protein
MTRQNESEFDKLVAAATAHNRARHPAEAEAAYRAALTISPGNPAVLQNLGALVAARGEHLSALDCFDNVIAAEPRYAAAHYNRAILRQELGMPREAIEDFERVCALEPEHYNAHRALGFLWLAEGNRDRSQDHFARTYELRRGEDRIGIANDSLNFSTRRKLAHDGEQFQYLAAHRRDGRRFDVMARSYREMANDFPKTVTRLSDADLDRLGDDYNCAINPCDTPELHGHAVDQRPDREIIVRRFMELPAGAVFFDGLLTAQALLAMRRYLLESTIWHDFSHIDGFVASYLEDGLACPLLLQIADEIRGTFPELLGKRPLSQAWAFKGVEAGGMIDAHADDAAISVNFWLTPEEANLDSGRGGMVVCCAPPPPEWKVKDYHADKAAVAAFFEQHAGRSLIVPYRENRAVLFESRLFHRSDSPMFAAGYENHRINLTMLFGRHES